MVFESSEAVAETPATDLLSWILDSCPYSPDQPVSYSSNFDAICYGLANFVLDPCGRAIPRPFPLLGSGQRPRL